MAEEKHNLSTCFFLANQKLIKRRVVVLGIGCRYKTVNPSGTCSL